MRHLRAAGTPGAILLGVTILALTYLFPGPVFAADFDGDGIDDTLDNCPATYNPEQLNADEFLDTNGASITGDTFGNACDTDDDNDGKSDGIETFLGTSPVDNCGPHGWWADIVPGGTINISDVLALKPSFGSASGGPNFRIRHDVSDANGTINISDVLALKPVFGTSCTQATPTPIADIIPPIFRILAQAPRLNPAANCGGGPACVYLHSGEATTTMTLMSVPGRGFDFALDLTYHSGLNGEVSTLGYGWDFNHHRRLHTETDEDVVLLDGYGRTDTYDWTGSEFTAPKGYFTRLIRNVDSSYTERLADGTVIEYAPPDVNDISRMESITDRNGNQMTYAYDGVGRLATTTDTLGRDYVYAYDLYGRLETLTDHTGRQVRFLYDGELDLVKVISPATTGTVTGNDFPDGRQTQFEYHANDVDTAQNHNLVSIKMPNEAMYPAGAAITEFTYDSLDRVVSEDTGGSNVSGVPAGGTFTYDFAPAGGCSAPEDLCLTDPNGNQRDFRFNPDGAPVRATVHTNRNINPADPSTFITEYFYDIDVRLTRVDLPEGNRVEYDWDDTNPDRAQQGNLLEVRNIPDAGRGGDQAILTTEYTYDPMYNLVRTVVDPRGTDTGYVPPNGGAHSPARYTTAFTFDYEEACDFAALGTKTGRTALEVQNLLSAAGMCGSGLGDVNGDASTAQHSGNVVRIVKPTVELRPLGPQALLEGTTTQVQIELVQLNLVGQPIVVVDPEANVHTLEYHSEQDPDGNGTVNNPGGNPTTGGYLKEVRVDTASGAARNSGTDPATVDAPTRYEYNDRGALTRVADGRGVETLITRASGFDEVIQVSRAATTGLFVPSPPEPQTLVAEAFLQRFFYDHNGNLVVSQVEDRGNTSQADGNLPLIYLPPIAPNPDPLGGVPFLETTYEYDILHRLTRGVKEVGDAAGSGSGIVDPVTEYRYDRNGNHVLTLTPRANLAPADPEYQPSNVRSLVYDERDLVFTATRGGMTAQFRGLGANADIPEVTPTPDSPDISTFTFDYDANGNHMRTLDAEDTDGVGGAEETRYLYDGYDRLVSEVDAAGNQSFYQYDPASRVVSSRAFGPVGGATPTSNSAATFAQPLTPGSFTQPLLARTDYLYDEALRLFETNEHLFVSTGVSTVRTPVLTDGPLGTTNDGLVVTRYEYDRLDRLMFVIEDDTTAGDAYRETYRYDGASRPLSRVADPASSLELAFEYDDNSNLLRRTLTERSTGGAPALTEVFPTEYTYDSMDRLVREVDPLGHTDRYEYDSRDNLSSTSDAQNPVLIPDPLGLFAGNINEDGNTRSIVYDGLSRPIAQVADLRVGGAGNGAVDTSNPANPDGRVVSDTRFDVNSLVRATADDGSTSGDNNTSIGVIEPATPLGNVDAISYDDLDRMATGVYDDSTTIMIVYDRDDNVVQRTDQIGNVFDYTYDAANRLVRIDVIRNTGAGVVGTDLQTYEYDGMGRLTRATDNNEPTDPLDESTVTYAYDSLSRVLEEVQQLGVAPASVVSSQWAGDDNRLVLIYADSSQVIYEYDSADRVSTIRKAVEPFPFAEYDYIGSRLLERRYRDPATNAPLVRLTYRDAITGLDVGYDAAGRPVLMQHLDALNNSVSTYEYEYDRMGNILREGRLHSNREDTYAYDSLYRPTLFTRDATISPPGPPVTIVNYQLDGNGNWANQGTPNNMNEYLIFNGQPQQYDNNGNLKNDNVNSFRYDAFDRLVHVENAGLQTVTSNKYDALGRDVVQNITNTPPINSNATFIYDGGSLIEENKVPGGQQQYIDDGPGGLTTDWMDVLKGYVDRGGVVITLDGRDDTRMKGDFSRGHGVVRMDRAAAPGQPLFFHEDTTNDTGALSSLFQQAAERYTYDAYGVPRIEDQFNNPIPGALQSQQGNPFLAGGMYWNGASKLYEQAYNPDQGRTLTRGAENGSEMSVFSMGHPYMKWEMLTFSGNEEVWNQPMATRDTASGMASGKRTHGPIMFTGHEVGHSLGNGGAPRMNKAQIIDTIASPMSTRGNKLYVGGLSFAIPTSGPSFMPVVITGTNVAPPGSGSTRGNKLYVGGLSFVPEIGDEVLLRGIAKETVERGQVLVGANGAGFFPRTGNNYVFGYIADMPIRRPTGPTKASDSVNTGERNQNWNFGYIADMPIRFGYIADMPIRRPTGPLAAAWDDDGVVIFGYIADMPIRRPGAPASRGISFPAIIYGMAERPGNDAIISFGYIADMPIR